MIRLREIVFSALALIVSGVIIYYISDQPKLVVINDMFMMFIGSVLAILNIDRSA